MRNVKRLVISALIGIFALSAAGCGMIQKTPKAIRNQTVAKVGNTKITKGNVDDRLTSFIESLKAQYGDNYLSNDDAKEQYLTYAKQTLDGLVEEEVLLQKAKTLKLVPSEDELTKEAQAKMDENKKTVYGGDEKAFEEAMKGAGLTKATTLDYFKRIVILGKVYDYMTKGETVTDKEVEDYYNTNKASYTKNPGADLYDILISTQDNKRTAADALALANEIKAKLDKGEKFEDLAKQNSDDTATKDAGGSLGFVEYDNTNYDQNIMAAAKTLKENGISNPIKAADGYHIIQAKNLLKETKVTPLADVKEQIKASLLNQKQNSKYTSVLTKWKAAAGVKTYENNLV